MPTPLPPTADRLARHQWTLLVGGVALACALGLSLVGLAPATPALAGPATVGYVLLSSGPIALAYLGAGVGLAGPLAARLLRPSPDRDALQVGLGIGLILWLSHALGCVGLLSGPRGQPVAIGVVALGLIMLGAQCARVFKDRARLPATHPLLFAITPALGVLIVASCNPPGALWLSEAGGFDALAYHLPLPMEWTAGPRLQPLTHNVYSFLPGYVEAGFMHLDAALGGGRGERVNGGLISGDGWGVLACQFMQALCTVVAAWITARIARRALERAGAGARAQALGSAIAGALALATPWAVVTGSLAYNEAAAAVLAATALLACLNTSITPGRRALLVGLSVGLATGCKPTCAFLLAPGAGLLLLALAPARAWPRAALLAVLGGVIAFAPPLIRNEVACGNPVFPAGTSVFGSAHWTPEQVARFSAAHAPQGTLAERLERVFNTAPDPQTVDQQPRGIMHRQWMALFPAAALGLIAAALFRGSRGPALMLLVGMLAGLAWWVAGSHTQARFLLPLHVPAAAIAALGAGMLADRASRRPALWTVVGVLGATPLVQSAATLWIFLGEGASGGQSLPNRFLVAGPDGFTGASLVAGAGSLTPDERAAVLERLWITPFINVTLRPDDMVYQLGESTTAYALRPTLAHSTWDASPLGEAVRRSPRDDRAWAADLWARGVRFIAVNPSELRRLWQSNWYDPAVTPEVISTLLDRWCEPVRDFGPGGAPKLYRLRPPEGDPRPAAPPAGGGSA